MRKVRIFGVLVVVLAMAAVLAVAPPLRGQSAREGDQRPRAFELDWMDGAVHIGASVRDVDSADAAREKLGSETGGAVIDGVDSDGPAAQAGLKVGDVLVEYDGERVRSARHLIRLVRESRADRAVTVVVLRAGRRTDVTVSPRGGRLHSFRLDGRALGDSLRGLREFGHEFGDLGRDFGDLGRELGRDFSFELDGFPRSSIRGRLGVTVQQLTGQLAEYFGVKEGVLVTAVGENTPASKAGVKAGDVLTSVNGRSIATSRDLIRELQDVDGGKEVSLDVTRDRKALTLKATLEDRPFRRPRITRRGA